MRNLYPSCKGAYRRDSRDIATSEQRRICFIDAAEREHGDGRRRCKRLEPVSAQMLRARMAWRREDRRQEREIGAGGAGSGELGRIMAGGG